MFDLVTISILVGALLALLVLRLTIRYVPNQMVGIVEKLWSLRGSIESGLIALDGKAGFQPVVLRGGIHFLVPFQYAVHRVPLVTIPQGQIGYVFARDGLSLESTQSLASNAKASDFEDVAAFLKDGGQRGPQRKLLREGTYALNLAQFAVITADRVHVLALDRTDTALFERMQHLIAERDGFRPIVIRGADDKIGIVTVHDGPPLEAGEIIAPVVGDSSGHAKGGHDNFQDPEAFLLAGGRRGRQLQVLVDGTWFLNRLFATVELVEKTVVEVGSVGVVVWYAGATGPDLSGADYKHGELVARGERGVWREPLLPGKYAFNTCAGRVISVPTTNFILKWIRSEAGAHRFDENLKEVSLITKDAFEPSLPLSVVVHIDYRQAPLVIQRFGDVRRLVEQTIDPMVSAYFKNVGQTRTLIQLLQDRSAIQDQASAEMQTKFRHYNIELEEVLIGTPTSVNDSRIEEILAQLRARQIAEEQIETYVRQQKAADQERVLREAESRAREQQRLTESEIAITIRGNQGKAEYQRAVAEAAQVRLLAEANAEREARIGVGKAIAAEELVRAYGGPRFQVTQQVMDRFAQAIETARVDVVPKIVVGGNGREGAGESHGSGTGLIETLLTLLLSDRMLPDAISAAETRSSPIAEAMRADLRAKIARNGDASPQRPAA